MGIDPRHRRRSGALALVAILSLGLTACTEEVPDARYTEAAPTSAPVRVVVDPPSRVAIECADLQQFIDSVYGEPAPLVTESTWPLATPLTGTVRQDGGLDCRFGHAGPPVASSPLEAYVVIVGDAVPAWLRFLEVNDPNGSGGAGEPQVTCVLTARPGCGVVGLVGDVWVQVGIWSTPLSADSVEGSVRAAFEAIGAEAERALVPREWSPPVGTIEVSGCRALLGIADYRELIGRRDVDLRIEPDTSASITQWLYDERFGADVCQYLLPAPDDTPTLEGAGPAVDSYRPTAELTWLPGGEWAMAAVAGGDELPLTSADDSDAAYWNCDPLGDCVADIFVGGHWVQFAPSAIDPEDRGDRELAGIVAERVAQNMSAPAS